MFAVIQVDRKHTYLAIISQVIGTDHCFKRVLNKGYYLIPAVLVWLFFFSYSRQLITPSLLSGFKSVHGLVACMNILSLARAWIDD